VRADAARADRYKAVRDAAHGWRNARAIDEEQLRSIVAAFRDDRGRLGLGLRILAGLAAFVGGGAFIGLLGSIFWSTGGGPVLACVMTLVFTAATEYQIGPLRRAQGGAEYATAVLAVVCGVWAWVSLFKGQPFVLMGAAASILIALAAWRWGYALLAAVATICFLVTCSQGNFGRVAWLALGPLAFPLMLRSARSPRRPPAHRRCLAAIGLILLTAAYVAVNPYSLDHRWIEQLAEGFGGPAPDWLRFPAIAGTILMPPLVLAVAVRYRNRLLLAAGALFTAASLVTLRRYHPIGPWWLSLTLGGIACLALAVAIRRWLSGAPARERAGFTAEPLFEDRRALRAAQAATTLIAMSPAARAAPDAHFEGGGGRSGGGGASGGA